MASISAFMTGGQRQYPSHYMETAISTYVDACRQHQFATRATLFGVEAFKSQGMYSKAAFALLKMTGEVRRCTVSIIRFYFIYVFGKHMSMKIDRTSTINSRLVYTCYYGHPVIKDAL